MIKCVGRVLVILVCLYISFLMIGIRLIRSPQEQTAVVDRIIHLLSAPDKVRGKAQETYTLFGPAKVLADLPVEMSVDRNVSGLEGDVFLRSYNLDIAREGDDFFWRSYRNQRLLPLQGIIGRNSEGREVLMTVFVSLEGDGAILITHGHTSYDGLCAAFFERKLYPVMRYTEIRTATPKSSLSFAQGYLLHYLIGKIETALCEKISYMNDIVYRTSIDEIMFKIENYKENTDVRQHKNF